MDLVNRLKFFLEKNNIAISQFADTCGIPRPTLSQILNGRNKKISDELISKIHAAYPALSILWLMFGEGSMETSGNIALSEPQNPPIPEAEGAYQAGYKGNATKNSADGDQHFFTSENQFSPNNLFTEATATDEDSFSSQEFTNKDIAAAFGATHAHLSENGSAPDNTESNSGSSLLEGAISFYPRHEGRPTQKVTSSYIAPEEKQAAAPATESTEDVRPNTASDSFIPYTPPAPEPYGNSDPLTNAIRNESNASVSVPADPGKKITNIVVFYSDNSFQSFYPS